MALPLCILVSVGGRRSQCPGRSPTLGSLGPSHQRRYKSRVSLRGPLCGHDVLGTPHGEVHDRNQRSHFCIRDLHFFRLLIIRCGLHLIEVQSYLHHRVAETTA